MTTSGKRGPYRKGIQRREAILQAALTAYAEADAGGPTLRSIAEKVGLTETAVLHYFASREELFVAVIAARDRADAERAKASAVGEGFPATYGELIARNAETPGLVQLFAETAAAAANPSHPGHEYFAARYAGYVDAIAHDLVPAAEAGEERDRARWVARILIAASDGLQLQWLADPSIDMRSDLERLESALRPHVSPEAADPR